MRRMATCSAALILHLFPLVTNADALAWMSGAWCSRVDGAEVEETWLAPRGGLMIGVNRTTADDRNAGFEFLRIEAENGMPVRYLAQPGGQAPTAFALEARGENWIRFENPEHDFPQRIEYRRDGDRLAAVISGPGEDGADFSVTFEFSRCQ